MLLQGLFYMHIYAKLIGRVNERLYTTTSKMQKMRSKFSISTLSIVGSVVMVLAHIHIYVIAMFIVYAHAHICYAIARFILYAHLSKVD